MFFRIEGNDGVARFPDTIAERVAAVTDTGAEGPDPNEPIQMAVSGCDASGHHVSVVENGYGNFAKNGDNCCADQFAHIYAFELDQIRGIFHCAFAHDTRHAQTNVGRVSLRPSSRTSSAIRCTINFAGTPCSESAIVRLLSGIQAQRSADRVVRHRR